MSTPSMRIVGVPRMLEQLGVLGGGDGDHLDRRLERVLGQHLDEVLAGGHRGGVVLGVEQLDAHRRQLAAKKATSATTATAASAAPA